MYHSNSISTMETWYHSNSISTMETWYHSNSISTMETWYHSNSNHYTQISTQQYPSNENLYVIKFKEGLTSFHCRDVDMELL